MRKTFKQVVREISRGEEWVCDSIKINCLSCGTIEVESIKIGEKFSIYEDDEFVRRRKEYTFAEAFESYEIGREIESVVTSTCYLKESGNLNEGDKHFLLGMKEIRGKWYIND